jgi:hypothetical protein
MSAASIVVVVIAGVVLLAGVSARAVREYGVIAIRDLRKRGRRNVAPDW